MVINVVSPPSLRAIELSIAGRNPQELPEKSLKEVRMGAVGTGWLTKAISMSMLGLYTYVTRVENGWLGCNAMKRQ